MEFSVGQPGILAWESNFVKYGGNKRIFVWNLHKGKVPGPKVKW